MQSYAVVLFFVLSGFLITTLLLKEKEKYNKIDFKKFYFRRILRIWPVY
jgi:peptidoglycan/LPS O-acetylase OafA/YrhL